MIELLCCVGLHWVLKYGTVLNVPRKYITRINLFDGLFKCSLCLGFWCGVIVSFLTSNEVLLFGFASAATCWFLDNINNTLQSVEIKLDKQ